MGGRCRREWTVTAWRALVHEAVAASEPITSGGRDKDAAVAVRLGLLEPIGRRRGDTAGHPILYRPTEAGRLLAEGRIAVASQRTGAPGRPKLMLAATWLRALPQFSASEWGGMCSTSPPMTR